MSIKYVTMYKVYRDYTVRALPNCVPPTREAHGENDLTPVWQEAEDREDSGNVGIYNVDVFDTMAQATAVARHRCRVAMRTHIRKLSELGKAYETLLSEDENSEGIPP